MDSFLGDLIPLFGIFMIICVVVIPIWLRSHYASRDRARLHETVRMMLEKGQPVSSEMLESLNVASQGGPVRIENSRSADMRRGVTLVAIALGIAATGVALYWVSDGYATGPIVGGAAFPGFIGLGFIVMALVSPKNTKKKDL
jgi:hypothetical protein